MHVQQPYVQLVAAQPPQYQLCQPLAQPPQYQPPQYQLCQPSSQPPSLQLPQQPAVAHEQMLMQFLMQSQQQQQQQQSQQQLQPAQSYHKIGGSAQLLDQLMVTPLWRGGGDQAVPPSGASVPKEPQGSAIDADAIAARVLEKVHMRFSRADAAPKQPAYDDLLREQGSGTVELKSESGALNSHALHGSPTSVRSLASSIVDSVSDVLEEAERNRQAAERRAARAEAIAEDAQHRLSKQSRRPTPSADTAHPQPRRLTPPQRDEALSRAEAPSSVNWSPGKPQHDGTPQHPRRLQSPDVTPERRVPDRTLRLSAASKQTHIHQDDVQVTPTDTVQQRVESRAAPVGSRLLRQQRVANLQSWRVAAPVETRQQGTQTTGHESVDELTPVSRMKKLMEAVAAAEEKARVMGEETAQAREECQTAKARSASMVEQHDELKAMLEADAMHTQKLASQELGALKASLVDERARSDGALRRLQVAQSKISELEDAFMRERNALVNERSEIQQEAELTAKASRLEAHDKWVQQRRQLEAAVQEARQELADKQQAQRVAEGTVAERIARVESRAADAQDKHNKVVAELERVNVAREQAEVEAARATSEEANMREQVGVLREHINTLREQLEGVKHEMQVKDIQAERRRRSLVEENEKAKEQTLTEQRNAEIHISEIQRLSGELEVERERRQKLQEELSTTAARSQQRTTEQIQRLSRELEDERERRQTAEEALSDAAARSRQVETEAIQRLNSDVEDEREKRQTLSHQLEDERERRQTAEEALSAAAARSRQMTTQAASLSTPAKESSSEVLAAGDSSVAASGHSPAGGHTPAAMHELKAAFSELRRQTAEAEQAKAKAADASAACEWLGEQLAATEAQLQQLKDRLHKQQSPNMRHGQDGHLRDAAAMVGAINRWSRATHTEIHHADTTLDDGSSSSAPSVDNADTTGTPVPSSTPAPTPAPLTPSSPTRSDSSSSLNVSGGFEVSPILKRGSDSTGRRVRSGAAANRASDAIGHDEGAKDTEHGSGKAERDLSLGLRGGTSVAAQFRARRRRGKPQQ